MINLQEIKKEVDEGKWFELPSDKFAVTEGDVAPALLLIPTDRKKLSKGFTTTTKIDKASKVAFESRNKEQERESASKALFESVKDWRGISDEFNRKNWDAFITLFGATKIGTFDNNDNEEDVSAWISRIVLDSGNFFKINKENLENTSANGNNTRLTGKSDKKNTIKA